jgi:hypothetical protein
MELGQVSGREVPEVGCDDDLRSCFDRRPRQFVEDFECPLCLDQTMLGDADQQVPLGIRIQRVGVVDDDKGHAYQSSPSSSPSAVTSAAAARRR